MFLSSCCGDVLLQQLFNVIDMKKIIFVFTIVFLLAACSDDDYQPIEMDNPTLTINIPDDFPEVNSAFYNNQPTKYGVILGEKLFHDKRLSTNNTIACASCHIQSHAFADNRPRAVGVEGRVGIRNTPPIQNLAFMRFYNWDGSKLSLEAQPIVPIITHEEMDSSIVEVIEKISVDPTYATLFLQTFGDEEITPNRIYQSIAQYEYSLISVDSKYDRVVREQSETFSESEARGYQTFQEKCMSCHDTPLFTDQSFRNIGFPLNTDSNEAGRARVTGEMSDYMSFRVPTLRNIAVTAPYGSFGQFADLRAVLDYFDNGVLDADNLDPILQNNNNRIPLSEQEKNDLLAFLHTLTDHRFINGN